MKNWKLMVSVALLAAVVVAAIPAYGAVSAFDIPPFDDFYAGDEMPASP